MFGPWTTPHMILICMCFVVNCGDVKDSCYCGYGGLCRFINNEAVKWNCSDCRSLSWGLYENCNHLVDHCKDNPCRNNGKCVMTFGSFFCECPPEFIGRFCKYRRTDKLKNLNTIVGPRAWFQVNRVHPVIDQPFYFTFEEPGDDIQLQVRFDDGRFYEVRLRNFKVVNAKQECLRDVRENPKERDIRVCETLLDKKVYSVKIATGFFNDGFHEIPSKVEIPSLGVVEGRVDKIHIAVMNEQIATFAQEYPIHTSFELSPKCGFYIAFKGCTRRKKLHIFHDKSQLIYLRALREPIGNCSVGIVEKMEWNLPAYGKYPFHSRTDTITATINGNHMHPGQNYVDFMIVMRGKPDYFGAEDLTYSYGRCWFKTVLGYFNVGILHGATRSVPCMSPLTMRLYSYNSNYPVNEFASIWKCRINKYVEGEGGMERCRKQRFLGSKVFYRAFPCGVNVKFEALILHIPTGLKINLNSEVETSIHIDTLHCRCSRNCRPNIDPRSKTKIWVDDVRLSTDRKVVPIKWSAWLTQNRTPWEIERFVVPETLGRAVEIEKGALSNLDQRELDDPLLFVRAEKGHLYCEMVLRVEVPFTKLELYLTQNIYMKDVDDFRNKVVVLNSNINFLNQPYTFEAREIISPGVNETVDTIKAGYNEFLYLKLESPTFFIAKNSLGLETSPDLIVPPINQNNSKYSIEQIDKMMKQTKTIVDGGISEVALTEVLYISRYVMVLPEPPLRLKMELLQFLKEITPLTFAAATFSTVSSHMVKILTIINRLTVVSDMTKPPFNINISPWVAPSNYMEPEEVLKWNEFRELASNIVLEVTRHFFRLVSEEGTTRHTKVIELLFQTLLRYSISRIWEPYWHKLVRSSIDLDVRYDRENAVMLENFERCVNLLLRASDYQAEGYKDYASFDSGTITFTYNIFPRNALSNVAFAVFNQYQRVKIRITSLNDTLEDYDRKEYNTLFLGVYVEIPIRSEMTTRVHIAFFTHMTQEPISALIEVNMRVQKPVDEDADITHRHNHLIVDYVRNSSSRKLRERNMALYKIEFSQDSDIISDKVDRNINLHFKSDAEIRFQIGPDLPNYEEASRNSTRGQGNFSRSLVIDRNFAYLAVLPGKNVPPDSPKLFVMEAEEFACVLRSHTSVIAGSANDKEICRIANEHYDTTVRAEVTCLCPGPGVIYTFQLTASLFKLLAATDEDTDNGRIEKEEFTLFYFWSLPIFLLMILVVSWVRDRRNEKREFIHVLEDSFPRETHPYIIGVFTGRNLSSGTEANVALKVHGLQSSSRVHILRINSHKVLSWGQDDWFLLYTKERLGRISEISIWHDFQGLCYNWFCRHIVLYDVESIFWYVFPIHRWIRIAEGIEFCRTATIRGVKFSPEVVNVVTFTFRKHYKRVLRNNSLISVFFKQRRHIFSYLEKALLFSMFLMSLLCSVIIVDETWTRKHYDYRFIIKTLIALTPAFLLLAVVSCIFMRSYDMTRKTRKLDLRKVNEIKRTILGHKRTIMGHVRPAAVMSYMSSHPGIDLLTPSPNSSLQSSIRTISLPRKQSSTRSKVHSRYNETLITTSTQMVRPQSIAASSQKKNSLSQRMKAPINATSSQESRFQVRGNLSSQHWTPGSIWLSKTTAQTWIPDASYRPLRFDHKLSYIRFGGKIYLIIGWILGMLVIGLALIFFILRTVTYGDVVGEDVVRMLLLAVILEVFIVEPVLLLATSCYSVYRTKQGNFECNILELGGLPANGKRVYDHLHFMHLVTQSCYRPLTTERLETLYHGYVLYRAFKVFLYFLMTVIFIMIPFVVLELQHDKYNIWRLEHSTSEIMTEPVNYDSPGKPLTRAYEKNGISNYLLSVYLPATSQAHWYNKKHMNFGKRELAWFIDRNSKLYGSTVIRILKASNNTKLAVHPLFEQYYSEAYGQFDEYLNKTTSISDWHEIPLKDQGSPTEDKITSNGVYGTSGIFYHQSIGEEIFIRDEKRHKALGIHKTVKDNIDIRTRALIVEMNVIHPSFSQSSLSPTFGVSKVKILFENAAAGPFSGTIHSSYGYAPSIQNYLRYYSITMFSIVSIVFGFYFIKKAWQEGFALLLLFRFWMVATIAVLAFIIDVLIVYDFLYNHVSVEIAMNIDVNTHVNSGHISSSYFEESFIGPFYLCLCILLTDCLNECLGVLYGRYEIRFLLLTIVAFMIYLFCSKCSEVAMKLFNAIQVAPIALFPINGKSGDCDGCKVILCLYGYIWFTTIGIYIACLSKGFEKTPRHHVFGYISSYTIPRCCRRRQKKPSIDAWDRRSVKTVTSKKGSAQHSQNEENIENRQRQYQGYSRVAERLRGKFLLFE